MKRTDFLNTIMMPSIDEYFIIGILHTSGGSSTGSMFFDSNLAMNIKNLDNIYHF